MSHKLPPLVHIHWRDACGHSGYQTSGLMDVHSAGWLVNEDEECITVAQDAYDDEDWRKSISIPKVNVKQVTYLQRRSNGKLDSQGNK